MALNFYQNIFDTLRREPSRVYIRWPVKGSGLPAHAYTGKDILDKVSCYRQLLQEKNLRKGDAVLIVVAVDIELLSMLLAVMAHGAVPVLPPAGIKISGLAAFLRKKEIRGLFAPGQSILLASLLKVVFNVRLLTTSGAAKYKSTCQLNSWEPPQAVAQEQAALISHSSGSTGKPKTVFRSHRILQAQHEALKLAFPPFTGQRDFPLFPNILLHNLSQGVCSILPCLPRFNLLQMEPGLVLKQIAEEGVHTLTGNVYYFKKLLAHLQEHPLRFPAVKALGIGGSPVPEYLLHACKKFFPEADVYTIYGSTEAEPIAIRKVGKESYAPQKGYCVGRLHPALQWRIRAVGKVQLQGRTYPVGELEVKGPHVVPKTGDGWLATGDFGYENEAGQLCLTGRKGNEKLHAGVQHYQVEHFLQEISGVEAAAAISGEKGFAVYVQGQLSKEVLEKRLKEGFSAAIIRSVNIREELPLDPRHHSKVLYAKVS